MKRLPQFINAMLVVALVIAPAAALVYLKQLKQDHQRCGDLCQSLINGTEQVFTHVIEMIEKKPHKA